MTPKEFEEIKKEKSHLIRYVDGKKIYQSDGKMELEKKHRGQFTIAEQHTIKKALDMYFDKWQLEVDSLTQSYGHFESIKTKANQINGIKENILIKVDQNTYK